MQVNMHKAKSQLSALAEKAQSGERVIIAKAGKPYVELVPYKTQKGDRVLGGYEGQVWMAPDFDETSPEIIAAFEGEDD